MSDQSDVQEIVQKTIADVRLTARTKPNPKQWLEEEIAAAKAWGIREVKRRHEARVKSLVRDERSARREGGKMRTATGMAVSGVSGVTDVASFGFAPELAGGFAALKAPFTGEDPEELGQAEIESVRAKQAARREVDPVTSTLGGIGGFFTGPAGLATRTGAKLAVGPISKLTRPRLTGTTAGFAEKAGLQTFENVAAGTGAITAYEIFVNREDNATLPQRVRSSVAATRDPLFLGISGVAGAVTGPLRTRQTQGAKRLVTELKRLGVPESQFPPSVMRDGTAFGEKLASAQDQIVGRGGLKALQAYGKLLGDNLQKSVAGLLGDAKIDPQRAGKIVRGLLAKTPEEGFANPKSPQVKGRIARRRKAIYDQAVREQGQEAMTFEEVKSLATAMTQARSELAKLGAKPTKDLQKAYNGFIEAFKKAEATGTPITMERLNHFRKTLNDFSAIPKGVTARTPTQAQNNELVVNSLQGGIRQVLEVRAPKIARANEVHGEYSRVLETFGGATEVVKATQKDFSTLAADIFQGGNVATRWNALTKGNRKLGTGPLLTKHEVQILRGQYLAEFFDDLAVAEFKGVPNMTAKLDKAWKSSKYNKEAFDTILGDGGTIRRAIRSETVMSDKFQNLIGAGAKGQNLPQVDASAPQTAALVVLGSLILRRPQIGIPLVLGEMGLSKFAHSSLQGKAAQRLNDLTREGFQPGITRLPQVQTAATQNPLLQGFGRSLEETVTGAVGRLQPSPLQGGGQ